MKPTLSLLSSGAALGLATLPLAVEGVEAHQSWAVVEAERRRAEVEVVVGIPCWQVSSMYVCAGSMKATVAGVRQA